MKKNLLRSLAALVAVFVLSAAPLFAQTALTTTTLGALLDNASANITVAAATGITAPGTGATFVYLLIDRELIGVRTINGLVVGGTRGANGTRATAHINGATVTVAPALAVINYLPSGACVRVNLQYVPQIVGGTNAQGVNGTTFDCLGVTTAGQWVSTNVTDVPILGSTVASPAGVLTPTGTYFKVSGTNAITGITVPAGATPGFTLALESTGIWTWTAAGNILTAGTTTAAGRVLLMIWNGAKWVPSYIA